MIHLSDFDYDVTSIDITSTDEETGEKTDSKIVIMSSFREEAVKAACLYER